MGIKMRVSISACSEFCLATPCYVTKSLFGCVGAYLGMGMFSVRGSAENDHAIAHLDVRPCIQLRCQLQSQTTMKMVCTGTRPRVQSCSLGGGQHRHCARTMQLDKDAVANFCCATCHALADTPAVVVPNAARDSCSICNTARTQTELNNSHCLTPVFAQTRDHWLSSYVCA